MSWKLSELEDKYQKASNKLQLEEILKKKDARNKQLSTDLKIAKQELSKIEKEKERLVTV